MNFWQGKICPVCKKEFTDKDDIVYCPECGTAHHRGCWKETNACFFAFEHRNGNFDTINELAALSQPPSVQSIRSSSDENGQLVCEFCGYRNNPLFRVCINCGHELTVPNPEYKTVPNYPPPPGSHANNDCDTVYNDDGKLVDDISRADLARFYGSNSEDVMERFKKISRGKNAFSVYAFFASFFWLFYHKVIGAGTALTLAVISPIIAFYGIFFVKSSDALLTAANTITDYNAYLAEELRILNDFMTANMSTLNICIMLTAVLYVLSMVFCGFFGMKLYYNKAIKTIRMIRQRSYDRYQREYLFAAKGGVNAFAVLLPIILYFFASSAVAYICLIFS